jgi:hypothetical protein
MTNASVTELDAEYTDALPLGATFDFTIELDADFMPTIELDGTFDRS